MLVSTTADGASVNVGAYRGLLALLQQDGREWILKIHCVCHRLELAFKNALLDVGDYGKVKDFMISLFYLFKRRGKLKSNCSCS